MKKLLALFLLLPILCTAQTAGDVRVSQWNGTSWVSITRALSGTGAIAATGGTYAGDVGQSIVTLSGSDSVPRTLADRFRDTINVKDFGAVPDSAESSSAAIQAAINSVSKAITDEPLTVPTFLLVDAMDDPISGGGDYTWTATNGATLSQQAGFRDDCLQISSGTTTLPGAVISGFSPINASSYSHLDVMLYAERPGKVRFTFSDGTNSSFYIAQSTKPNEWQHVRVRLTDLYTATSGSAAPANLSAITTIAIEDFVQDPPSGRILKVDDLGFSNEAWLAHPMVHPALTTVEGSTEGVDFRVDPVTGQFFPLLGGNLSSGEDIAISYRWGGGRINFPPGNFNIATTIDLPSWIELHIPKGTTLTYTGTATTDYMLKTNGTNRRAFITISGDGVLDGRRSTMSSKSRRLRAIQVNNTNDVLIEGITIQDFNDFAITAAGTSDNRVERLTVRGVTLLRCGGHYIDDDANFYAPLRAGDANAQSAFFDYVDWLNIQDTQIIDSPTDAFLTRHCRWGNVGNLIISRPRMGGLFLIDCTGFAVTGVVVDGAGSRGASIEANSNNNSFTGLSVIGSGREAVWISQGSSDNAIVGSVFYEAGLTMMPNGAIAEPGSIVRISESSHRNLIANNQIYASANYRGRAVEVSGGTGNKILNNSVFGNPATTALYSDAGTNTMWLQPNYQTNVQVVGMPPRISPQTWERFAVVGDGNTGASINAFGATATDAPINLFFRARGTSQAPADVQAGDRIGMQLADVWSNSGRRSVGALRWIVEGGAGTSTPSSTAIIETTGTSSSTRTPRLSADLHGVRTFLPASAPADGTLNNNEAALYYSGTSLRVKWKDNSGSVTDGALTITP